MMSNCDTSSIRVKIAAIALSKLGLTTTLNTDVMLINDLTPAITWNSTYNTETTTPSPKKVDIKNKSNYEMAKELFGNKMRDFTEEEAKIYNASLKKIYKPIGVNIFDIC